jgi:hypothetical protein
MLSREHCRRRVERLRTLLICTPNPAAGERLTRAPRRFPEALAQFDSDLDRMIERACDSKVDLWAVAEWLYRKAEDLRLSSQRLALAESPTHDGEPSLIERSRQPKQSLAFQATFSESQVDQGETVQIDRALTRCAGEAASAFLDRQFREIKNAPAGHELRLRTQHQIRVPATGTFKLSSHLDDCRCQSNTRRRLVVITASGLA